MGSNRRKSRGRGNDAAARARGSRQVVLDAIVAIAATQRCASRQSIADRTGLKLAVVDDHVKNLKDDGEIWAPSPGSYEPMNQFPPARSFSKTVLANGTAKLELADDEGRPGGCWDLTPQERAELANLMWADAICSNQTEADRRHSQQLDAMQSELKGMRRLVAALSLELTRLRARAQPDLFAQPA